MHADHFVRGISSKDRYCECGSAKPWAWNGISCVASSLSSLIPISTRSSLKPRRPMFSAGSRSKARTCGLPIDKMQVRAANWPDSAIISNHRRHHSPGHPVGECAAHRGRVSYFQRILSRISIPGHPYVAVSITAAGACSLIQFGQVELSNTVSLVFDESLFWRRGPNTRR